jgi:tRNA A-37 threonylcarbamoyl transferase component Bud32
VSTLEGGRRVGRYRIVRFLGAGAMGEVYLAEDPHIERRLAIKTVRLAGGRPQDIEDRKKRLLREARAAGRLLHPNVVTLFDTGEEEGLLYLAFEFVEGHDLASRLESGEPPTLREVLRVVRQVADALDYAHRQGIVHRDIKPSNILIDTTGHVKVADFGIAKVSGQNTELTVVGSVMGSPQYLSPEQIRGDELDGRSDIFSLGVVFYELLSGRRPFDGETITTLVYQILHKDPAIHELRAVPLRIDQLLHHMLAKDRDQRIATAALVAEELAAIERELPEAVLAAPAAPASEVLDATRVMQSRSVSPASAGLAAPAAAPPPFTGTAPTAPAPAAAGFAAAAPFAGAGGAPAAAPGTWGGGAADQVPYAGPPLPPQTPGPSPWGQGSAGTPVQSAPPGPAPAGYGSPGLPPGVPWGAVPPPAAAGPAAVRPAVQAKGSSNAKVWLFLGAILIFMCTVLAAGAYWVWQRYLRHPDTETAAAASSSSTSEPGATTGAGSSTTNAAGGATSGNGASPAGGTEHGSAGGGAAAGQATIGGSAGAATSPAGRAVSSPSSASSASSGSPASAAGVPPASPSSPLSPRAVSSPATQTTPRPRAADRGSAPPAVAAAGAGAAGSAGGPSGGAGSADTLATRRAQRPPSTATPPSASTAVEPPPFVPAGAGRGSPAIPAPQPVAPGTSRTSPSMSSGTAGSAATEDSAAAAPVPAMPAADRVLSSSLELAFQVNPPDAYVLLDGGVIGKAEEWSGKRGNRAFTLPGAGPHQIKIKKSGMKDYRINVEASATRGVTPVVVTLQPLPTAQVETTDLRTVQVRQAVALHVQPDVNTLVLVDGTAAGQAKRYAGRFGHSDEWLQLPPGTHRITLVAPGYRRTDLAVDVTPGAEKERQKVDVTLVPDTGN